MNRERGFEAISTCVGGNINIPQRKTKFSAGYDIESLVDVVILPKKMVLVATGLKAYMMDNEVLKLYVRSSVGIKKSLMLANSTGIIDADYYNNNDNEGHIFIPLYNYGEKSVLITKGERIAQGIFDKYLVVDNDEAEGKREGGLGSTN